MNLNCACKTLFLFLIHILQLGRTLGDPILVTTTRKPIAGDEESKKIRWVPIHEFSEEIAIPAGWEEVVEAGPDYVDTYYIQGEHEGRQLVGSYSKEKNKCVVDYDGALVEIERKNCKFLAYPWGTMSWLYASTEKMPDMKMMIKAAKQDKNILYVCRAVQADGNLVPGALESKEKKCVVGTGAQKTVNENFEVLYVNSLGVQLFKRIKGIDKFMG